MKSHAPRLVVGAAFFAALFGLTPPAAFAAPATWIGGGTDNFWNNGTNWLTGAPPVTGADSLIFGGANTGNQNNFTNSTFTGITFAGGASSFTLNGANLHLGFQTTGVGITHSGDIINGSSNAQTIGLTGLTLDPGKHVITTGSADLNLKTQISQSPGSTAIFTRGSGNINLTGSGLSNTNGVLGGWATIGGDWAALDGSGNVVPFSNYADVAPGGVIANNPAANVRIPLSGAAITTAAGATNINSLLFSGSNAAQNVNIGTGNTLVLGQNGGIYNAAAYAGGSTQRNLTLGAALATGGTITAGDGIHPATITFIGTPLSSNAASFQLNSVISDNGSAKVAVVLMGGYLTSAVTATSTQKNTYTGGTYVLQGRISQALNTQIGQGDVYIYPGGEINTTSQFPTANFFIAGNGTTEQGGLGALRLFGAGAAAASIGGTVTLMDNASIAPTNASTTLITGRITGTGNLTIGGTNGSQGGGTLTIGKNDGSPSQPNNYTGDTIISGHTGGTAATVITSLIINSNTSAGLNDNIMPHGATGSFSGGPTGNMILNAFTPSSGTNRSATLDLNGSKQTINGLSSTSVAPNNNFITSSNNPGVLVLGDNNANGNFGGILQNGAGLSLTKIGAGTQILTNTNTYTGNTTVAQGVLSVTGALDVGSAVNVGPAVVNGNNYPGGVLAGTGSVNGAVTLSAGGVIDPGATGAGSTGTLAVGSLNVGAGATLRFDATAGGSDQISSPGAVTFGGASTITPNITQAGTYTLVQASSITGTLPTVSAGDTRLTYGALTPVGNSLTLTASGSVASVNWVGGLNGNVWDLHATGNWSSAAPTNPTLFYNGDNVTFANSPGVVSLNSSVSPGSVLFNNPTGNFTISGSGSIGGPGTVTVGGAGSVTLATNNTYGGGTVLNNGTLNINKSGALGSPAATGLTINGGALGNTSGQAVTVSSNPTQTWNANVVYSGPFDLNLGTGAVSQGAGLAANANRTVTVNGGNLTIGGIISDGPNLNNGLVKLGSGTLVLSGVNTFTGSVLNPTDPAVIISAGTLKVGNFSALGAGGTIKIDGTGTLDIGAIPILNTTGFGSKTFIISGSGANGQGAIVNTGTAGQNSAFQNIKLAANATFGGDGQGSSGTPTITGNPPNASSFYNPGRWDLRGGTLDLGGFTLTKTGSNEVRLANVTTTPGNIVVNQGILMFETPSSADATGTITVNSGATLGLLLNGSSVINNPIALNGANVNDASATTSTLGQNSTNLTLQGNSTFSGPNTAANLSIADKITGNGSLTKTGVSTLTLANINTDVATRNNYSGGTNLNGGVVNFAALAALGTGPLSFSGGTLQYGTGVLDDVSVLPITLNAGGGTIDTNSNTPISLAHNIVGTGGLSLKGNSTITLSATNTYAGSTTVQNGTVILGSAGALPANTALFMGSAANESPTLDLAGCSISVSGLSSVAASTPTIGNGSTATNSVITFNGGANATTFAGSIQDGINGGTKTTSLIVNSGKLTLTGGNVYTGNTTVNGGSLILGQNGTLASTTPLALAGGTFGMSGTGQNQTLATLSQTASSTIDFGTGASGSILHFTTAAPTWIGTLTIGSWTGSSPNSLLGGGIDQLYVDSNSLTVAQKNAIKFDGFPAGSQVLGTNEIVPSLPGYIPGDWNKSGALDKNDITTMLSALTDLNAFATTNGYTPGDIRVIGDLDGSGAVTNVDIQKELDLLASAGLGSTAAVPEPASFALLALGGIGLFAVRRRRSEGSAS